MTDHPAFWVVDPLRWGFAGWPGGRHDGGAVSVYDQRPADGPTDFALQLTNPVDLATNVPSFAFTEPASVGDSVDIAVGEQIASLTCRASVVPFEPGAAMAAVSIPAPNHPEAFIALDPVPSLYHLALVAENSTCDAGGDRLILSHGLPFPVEPGDLLQLFMPDNGHSGAFGTRFLAQQLLRETQENQIHPRTNLVRNGRMEDDCSVFGWTSSGPPLASTDWSPWARARGSVMGKGCLWGNLPAAKLQSGATLRSVPIAVEPGETYFIRGYFEHDGAIRPGLRFVDATNGEDLCQSYSAEACTAPDAYVRLTTAGAQRWSVAGGDPTVTGYFAPQWSPCSSYCPWLARIVVPEGIFRIQIEILVAGKDGELRIDEIEMFAAPAGQPAPPFPGETWMLPDGDWIVEIIGDSRSARSHSDLFSAIEELAPQVRPDLRLSLVDSAIGGRTGRQHLVDGFGCSTSTIGPDCLVNLDGRALQGMPEKSGADFAIVYLDENDAKGDAVGAGLIEDFVRNVGSLGIVTRLSQSVGTTTAVFSVEDTSNFPLEGFRLRIGNELVTCGGRNSETLGVLPSAGCWRGFGGTTAVAHEAGERVELVSMLQVAREEGATMIVLGGFPWRGNHSGSDTKCIQDPATDDCAEWLVEARRRLIVHSVPEPRAGLETALAALLFLRLLSPAGGLVKRWSG